MILRAAVGYTDAQYSKSLFVAPGAALVTEGDKLDSPPWHVSLAADYSFPVVQTGKGYLHVQYDYDGAYDLQNSADVTYDAKANHILETRLMSARLGFRPGNWDASVFVNNLLDSHDRTSLFHDVPSSDLIRYTSFRPRTVGLTVSYRY